MYGHHISLFHLHIYIYIVLVLYTKLELLNIIRTRTRDCWLKVAKLSSEVVGYNNLVLGRPMLSSHPTDIPHFVTKTPGRALANRGENLVALPVKGKNTNGVPRTPFQPASARECFPVVYKANSDCSTMQCIIKWSKIKKLAQQLVF